MTKTRFCDSSDHLVDLFVDLRPAVLVHVCDILTQRIKEYGFPWTLTTRRNMKFWGIFGLEQFSAIYQTRLQIQLKFVEDLTCC